MCGKEEEKTSTKQHWYLIVRTSCVKIKRLWQIEVFWTKRSRVSFTVMQSFCKEAIDALPFSFQFSLNKINIHLLFDTICCSLIANSHSFNINTDKYRQQQTQTCTTSSYLQSIHITNTVKTLFIRHLQWCLPNWECSSRFLWVHQTIYKTNFVQSKC